MVEFVNYYELFEVSRKASSEEIKKAYREKIKYWHPDKNKEDVKKAEEMTRLLTEGYKILSDPEERHQYDRMLKYTKGKSFDDIKDENFYGSMDKGKQAFAKMVDELLLLYNMFRDGIKGKYKLTPLTLATIGAALLYMISPIDFIPDLIPGIGFVDDAAVLGVVIKNLAGELKQYKQWKLDNPA